MQCARVGGSWHWGLIAASKISRHLLNGTSFRKELKMDDPVDEVTKGLANLTLLSGFFEHACDGMTQKFSETWRDPSKKVSYKWGNVCDQTKRGDEAERYVVNQLSSKKMCELLEEPVYMISGRP